MFDTVLGFHLDWSRLNILTEKEEGGVRVLSLLHAQLGGVTQRRVGRKYHIAGDALDLDAIYPEKGAK